jgi:hypothetical protein
MALRWRSGLDSFAPQDSVQQDNKESFMTSSRTTKVVHCKRTPFDIYIGRPSKWGNPFVIGRDGNRGQVIEKYRAYILDHPALLAAVQSELKGKVLGCGARHKAAMGTYWRNSPNRSEFRWQRRTWSFIGGTKTTLVDKMAGCAIQLRTRLGSKFKQRALPGTLARRRLSVSNITVDSRT